MIRCAVVVRAVVRTLSVGSSELAHYAAFLFVNAVARFVACLCRACCAVGCSRVVFGAKHQRGDRNVDFDVHAHIVRLGGQCSNVHFNTETLRNGHYDDQFYHGGAWSGSFYSVFRWGALTPYSCHCVHMGFSVRLRGVRMACVPHHATAPEPFVLSTSALRRRPGHSPRFPARRQHGLLHDPAHCEARGVVGFLLRFQLIQFTFVVESNHLPFSPTKVVALSVSWVKRTMRRRA